MHGKFMASALVAVAMISILAQARGLTPADPHGANAVWIEPSHVDLFGISPGHRFNVTVWTNCSIDCVGWQFRLTYANAYINASRAGYTLPDGSKSEFFQNLSTITFNPVFWSHNATHNRVDFGELRGVPGSKRNPGFGSLAWIEFEVTSLPIAPCNVFLGFEEYEGSPQKTFLLDSTGQKIGLNADFCLVKFLVSQQPTNALWLVPSQVDLSTSMISVGYRFNVTVWASCSVDCIGWRFSLVYENSYVNASRAGYTDENRSQFFQNITTSPDKPLFDSYDATHNRVVHDEIWLLGDFRSPGFGSLTWVEFEVISIPTYSYTLTLEFYEYTGWIRNTYLLDINGQKVDLNVTSCIVEFSVPQQLANAMWFEPSQIDLSTITISAGHRFNVTIWASCTVTCGGWQFWLVYENAYINATRAGYTAGSKSEFFENITTIPVTPVFKSHDVTHNRVEYGESWRGLGDKRSPSRGSLAWVEFEVTGFPTDSCEATMEFYAYTGSSRRTFLINATDSTKPNLDCYTCLIRLGPRRHDANALWFDPSVVDLDPLLIYPGYRFNVTVWANCSANCSGWQAWICYENAHINAVRGGYTAGNTSRFFQNITSICLTPMLQHVNTTHNGILFNETWIEIGDRRSPGYESLAWIEFNLTSIPTSAENNTIDFCERSGLNVSRRTYLLDATGQMLDLNASLCFTRFPQIQNQVGAMLLDRSRIDLDRSFFPVGYRFNVTVSANCSFPCDTWQFWLVCETGYIIPIRAGYTAGGKSEFFQNISTISTNPKISNNITHNRIELGESWSGSGVYRGPGAGSLAWVEFEVNSFPANSYDVLMSFDAFTGANPRTYMISGTTGQKVNLTCSACTVKLLVVPVQSMLDIAPAFGGSTNPFQGTYTYAINQVVSVQAWADIGYAFDHWVLDGRNVGAANPLQVIMDTNHTLGAVFIKAQPANPQPTPYVAYDYGPIIFALTTLFVLIPLGLGVRSAMSKRKCPTPLPGYAPPPTPSPKQPGPIRKGWNECPRCGYVNMPNYNFCGKCGLPLTDRDENTQIY
jgi:ribosomal protein S27AE